MTWCRRGARGGSTARLGWACAVAVVCERSRQRTVLLPLLASWTLRVRRRVMSLSAPRPVAVGGARSEARAAAPSATVVSHARWIAALRAFVSCVCVMSVCSAASVWRRVWRPVCCAGRGVRAADPDRAGRAPLRRLPRLQGPSSSWTRGYPGIPMSNARHLNCITWRYHYATLRCSSAFLHVFLVLVVNVVIT